MQREAVYQLPLIGDFDIRRELLLFDKIYIPEILIKQKTTSYNNVGLLDSINQMHADLDFLVKNNQVEVIDTLKVIQNQFSILGDPSKITNIVSRLSEDEINNLANRIKYYSSKGKYIDDFQGLRAKLRQEIDSDPNQPNVAEKLLTYSGLRQKYDGVIAELISGLMELTEGNKKVTPVTANVDVFLSPDEANIRHFKSLTSAEVENLCSRKQERSVASIILKQMPIPNLEVPLERILEFKSNDTNIRKLRDLNHWMGKMGRTNTSSIEICQEIEYLTNEYKRLLELSKMKYKYSRTEIILNLTLGNLERLVKMKWGELASSFFELKKTKVDLELTEAQLTGRELAYIVEVNESFK